MWPVANFVKGLSVDEAIKQLSFQNNKGAKIAKEVSSFSGTLSCLTLSITFSFPVKGLSVDEAI